MAHIILGGLTGAPCGGKTTILSFLLSVLPEYGVRVFVAPEAAREVIASGARQQGVTPYAFQRAIMRMQLAHQAMALELARSVPGPSVVLCDRMLMDNLAYEPDLFDQVLAEVGVASQVEARDTYAFVLNLVTAAIGAEEFYACDAERLESKEEARELDGRIRQAWEGHEHFYNVDNSTNFEGKKLRTLQIVLRHLGLPAPLGVERKFLVGPDALAHLPESAQAIDIEQVYLGPIGKLGTEDRIRRRGQHGSFLYFRAIKQWVGRIGRYAKSEHQIDEAEYVRLKSKGTKFLKKTRHCFHDGGQYFFLDDIKGQKEVLLLEVRQTEYREITLPAWARSSKEVTRTANYRNSSLATLHKDLR